jgi:hypothetical protein
VEIDYYVYFMVCVDNRTRTLPQKIAPIILYWKLRAPVVLGVLGTERDRIFFFFFFFLTFKERTIMFKKRLWGLKKCFTHFLRFKNPINTH